MNNNMRTPFHTRQYMVSKDFEIYYYSDRNMKNVCSHTHDYYEFYFFLSGDVSIEIDGNAHSLSTGDVIIIPPKTRHHMDILNSELAYNRYVFWISKSYYEYLSSGSEDYTYVLKFAESGEYIFHLDVLGFSSIQAKVIRLIEEQQGKHFGKNAQLSLCVCDLILNFNKEIHKLKHPSTVSEGQRLCQNLLAYIENHLGEPLLLDQLSREFFISKYHLSHIFTENLGIPIHQFILKKRLQLCKDAILTQASISDAALQCGFQDYSSFFRAFKKEYRISPKEYRELHKFT